MSSKIIFIIGGARSGKSSFALKEASNISGKKAYIATAEALDSEMKGRIEKHRKDRGNNWDVYEEPLKISDVLSDIKTKYDVVVIDCLTLWLSNLMHSNKDIKSEIESFCSSLFTVHCPLFTVSNEVGMGIVPDNKLAREFRDLAGFLNQKIAEIADEVYVVTAGIPVKIKNAK
ncbi:MAG: bifunctional adenosylcobinamide kinase/adenosylcobinamide-phosphate guanylyltransferase [Thermodesulfovibrionia bacterium]|nr:bifunctional adenosylcobinamide kinase/adenosylcobinamide-phosphate guanylyltransferase [Thermodesulfovibrionia bacterium]